MLFAPHQMRKRLGDRGREGLNWRFAEAWQPQLDAAYTEIGRGVHRNWTRRTPKLDVAYAEFPGYGHVFGRFLDLLGKRR
ncbi:hypothetical protein [Streptomyces sp. SLBN-118]|uniref:hypothetical protein n=1 Tax=Streptomyces sp. SLBN-118 TaxID=2768454 RepID=UPI0016429EB5|nr:hypothetical protein [Streptomyces sp. SLBN-118]